MDFGDYSAMDPPRRHGVATYFDYITSPINHLGVSDFLNALVVLSAESPDAVDIQASSGIPELSPPPPPPPPDAGPDQIGWGRSNSVMFLLYMVIGFTVTLAAILAILTCYYVLRYCYLRGSPHRRREESFTIGPEPKEIFVVVHPGGFTDVAYKEGNSPVKMVQRSKDIPVKYAYILAHTPDGVETSEGSFNIPAYHSCNNTGSNLGFIPETSTASASPPVISLQAVAVGPSVPPAEPWLPPAASSCHQASHSDDHGGEVSTPCKPSTEPSEGQGSESRSCDGQQMN